MSEVVETPAVSTSPVGWQAHGSLDFERWREIGHQLGVLSNASQWWLGDWLNYGQRAYGQKYREAIDATGYDVGSLMDIAWVTSRFEISRRREILSWSHHREVAPLSPEEQERWLDRAEKGGWSVRELRIRLNRGLGGASGPTPTSNGGGDEPEPEPRQPAPPRTVTCPECGHKFTP